MALQTCTLNLDRTKRELRPHGTPSFPCAGYRTRYTDAPDFEFPWHWHEEFEAVYLADGAMLVQIPGKSFALKPGDSIFINSGILHRIQATPCCELHSLVFSPRLITGSDDSAFAQKYITPLISCAAFDAVCSATDTSTLSQQLAAAFDALAADCSGYEFTVRTILSGLSYMLYQQFEKDMSAEKGQQDTDTIRIRKMIAFIQNHYREPLELPQIAQAANIGERECLRCFQRTIQISPIQYLIKYRLNQSARLLTQNKESRITDIALTCGFDSPSNFTLLFKRHYKCSPRTYRKTGC
jgi:AraC-like DNA-binding protein/quercetin dioxygenase-like cupin family protein